MTAPQSISGNTSAGQRWSAALMGNFSTPKIELVSGSGAVVTDADGKQYLDLLGGIAVNALGYAHPAIVAAVSQQIARLGHVSNYFSDPPILALAERLQTISGAGEAGRVLFTNSGTESNEAAFKIARLTGKPRIIATEMSFHGRTMGALAMTGQPSKREPFEPMPAGVEFVPYGDADALAAAIARDPGSVAAFICEPIQGEAGVRTPPDGYLAAVRRITSEAGALLILDEVQTGIGRTGAWFAHQRDGITPDVMTLAKGLGGGLPMGAVVTFGAASEIFTPGAHGSTFAGNPVCAAAALAVLDTIENERLLDHVDALGKHITHAIEDLNHPLVTEVRGRGLLIGVQLTAPVAAAANSAAAEAGFLTNAAGADVLRLAPPLILTESQADSFISALPAILDSAAVS
ncbi:MAG: acetylornithine transaminase [Nakamurella sp.]